MIGLLRLIVMGLIALSVIYLVVSWYSRSVRRERLENRADRKISQGRLEPARRDAFIDKGMRAYDRSVRKKLIWGVFVVPIVAVVLVIYVTNFM